MSNEADEGSEAIEISPQMIEAGVQAFLALNRHVTREYMIKCVFESMWFARDNLETHDHGLVND